MNPPHRPSRLVAGAAVLALLGACTGADDEVATAAITDAGLAATLADGADRLAALIEADDDCAAIDEAELLYTRAREGTDAGSVPPEVAREIEDVAAELTRDLDCADDPDPEPEATQDTATSEGSSGGGKGDGGKGEGGKGNGGKGNGGGKGK